MSSPDLESAVAVLRPNLTPEFVEATVRELLLKCQDPSRGIAAPALVQHLLGGLADNDERVQWAYERLRRDLGAALEEVPTLYYLDGD